MKQRRAIVFDVLWIVGTVATVIGCFRAFGADIAIVVLGAILLGLGVLGAMGNAS
jgi:hypothetical protein